MNLKYRLLMLPVLGLALLHAAGQPYKNFRTAVYSRAYETRKMNDPVWLDSVWTIITRQVPVDKIYLETHRDRIVVDKETLEGAKAFFRGKGVAVAGGITLTVDEGNRFETFCYSNPEHRAYVRELAEYTATHFDELILDDFFFTNCKCDRCIAGKGEKSWTDFRLELMRGAAGDLIIGPARAVNPGVRVVIKYPNWYEHFQGLGFDLELQPRMFDGIYTGTETRDPSGNQHLQAYLGYNIFRYFENIKPGGNGGGWVDTGGLRHLDRYAEQLWITLFAKAPEITLFDLRQLLYPLPGYLRAGWQGSGTSFDFDSVNTPLPAGHRTAAPTMAAAAGFALAKADRFLGRLGNPCGVKCYRPYHATGEDFIHNYLGMAGIPIDLVPAFPENAKVLFLAESAACDPEIVDALKKHLQAGNTAVITSGLLEALQDRGLGEIAEIRHSGRNALVREFRTGWAPPSFSDREILIPQITYLTNDSWEEISALDDTNGWPLLHSAGFGKGTLYILTLPDNFIDLCHLPAPVLNRVRQTLTAGLPAMLEGPGYASLFLYDNQTCIVESFADTLMRVRLVTDDSVERLQDLETGLSYAGTLRVIPRRNQPPARHREFPLELKPHSFLALQMEPRPVGK